MSESPTRIRLMQPEDLEAVVAIDEKIVESSRRDYYVDKFAKIVESANSLPISLVAEQDGAVLGFVMGELYMGEYGIFQEEATVDTIGVDPDCQHQGIGRRLMDEFVDHVKRIGVRKISTLVSLDDARLSNFFRTNDFQPSRSINLERKL